MKFYVNKFPIHDGWSDVSDNKEVRMIPVGKVFTIQCINGNGFEMKPVDKRTGEMDTYYFEPSMLSIAFSETDYLPQTEGKKGE